MKGRVVLCLFLLLATVSAWGQSTGAIVGVVKDQTGAMLPGVTVTVNNTATRESRQVITDESGRYAVPLLPASNYAVRFELPGFKTVNRDGIVLRVTERVAVDVALEVGALNDEITITANTQLVQTENATMGQVVEERQIRQLPLATRNFTQVLGLSSGTSVSVPDTAALGRGTQNISTSGARMVFNNFQINGIAANNIHTNSAAENALSSNGVAIPASDTIQEFKVQTSLYDAEHGRNSGANVNVVTKSGGPQFHGNVYEFFRNEKLNANNFFFNKTGQPRPILRQNQYGATIGGPIIQDKTFFFVAYQGTGQINGASLTASSSTLTLPNIPLDRSRASLGRVFAGLAGTRGGLAVAADGSNINPVALALLNAKDPSGAYVIPSPLIQGPGVNYAVSIPARYNEDQYTINLDHNFSSNNSLAWKSFIGNVPQTRPFAGASLPGFGYEQEFSNKNLSLSDRHTFGPRLFNELRLGYTRHRGIDKLNEFLKVGDIGMRRTTSVVYPAVPRITVTGAFSLGTGSNDDQGGTTNTYVLGNTLSIIKGGHSLRLGIEGTRYRLAIYNNFNTRGSIGFQSFGDFMIGRAAGSSAQGGNDTTFSNLNSSTAGTGQSYHPYRIADHALFLQDDWKVTPSLTVNMGIRYDLFGFTTDNAGRMGNYDTRLYQEPAVNGSTQAGFTIAENSTANPPGIPRVPARMVDKVDKNNFGPRFGLAYRPFAGKQIVIRSGYGIFYERMANQISLQLLSAPPFFYLPNLSGAANASATFENPWGNLPLPSEFPIVPLIYGPSCPGSLATCADGGNNPYPATRAASAIINVNPKLVMPYMQHYSFNVQYEFAQDFLAEVGYVGSKGTKLPYSIQRNQAILATPQNPVRGITTSTAANINLRVPYLGFSPTGINEVNTGTDSRYSSLQTSLTRRFRRGYQFNASYTWSKSLDNSSGGGSSTLGGVSGDQTDLRQARGLSDFNRTHRVVGTFIYELPAFGPTALQGWSFSGIVTRQSGLPFTITDGNGASLYGTGARANFAPGATVETAQLSGDVRSRLNAYFEKAAFASAGTGFGTAGRNILIGPPQSNIDFSIIKRTKLPKLESGNVEFRTEFFNLLNHANFDTPGSNLATTSTFGIISGTSNNGRLIQFALKVNF